MDVEQLKQDVRDGRIAPERLVDLIVALQKQLANANQRIEDLEKRIGGGPPGNVDQPQHTAATTPL